MAVLFIRQSPAPGPFKDYRRYKPFLRIDFRFQCCYCNVSEGYRNGADVFGVEHFRPRSKFPDLDTSYANLYYACLQCNSIKSDQFPSDRLLALGVSFVDTCAVDPVEGDWLEQPDGTLLEGRSPSGRFTIETIKLNRAACVQFRLLRREASERIARLATRLEHCPEPAREFVEEALRQARAWWEGCFGEYPRDPADGAA